jgi:L-2,4-diaminobutyrate decarboxylase
MKAPYYSLVKELRLAFPQPVSDRIHDAYFGHAIMQAIDQVDDMKSERPMLGEPVELDFEAARKCRIGDGMLPLEEVTARLVQYLSGIFVWGHPRSQINVIPPATIPSIIGNLLPSIYNPNLVSEETSLSVAVAEVEAASMAADLVGYDSSVSAGVFTFGGTGTLLYAIRTGLEKACPGTAQTGLKDDAVVVCSETAHYSCRTVSSWLGFGADNVIEVPTSPQNEMRTCLFETMLRDALKEGRKIAAIVATMGTTDAFGLDNLEEIAEIRDRLVDEFSLDYVPHLHADAVIGWAWSVFNDYDMDANPLGFRHRTIRALAGTRRRIMHLSLADSIGVDFHKTGFTPYVSSLYLVKTQADLELISREPSSMPYLFQSGEHHPGRYTLEASRSGSGPMAALGSLILLGKDGLRSLLGHLVTMSETLAEHLDGHASVHVLNDENFGPVTLFRVYPPGVDTFSVPAQEHANPEFRETLLAHNDYNRRIFDEIQSEALQGRGVVISLTECYRETNYGEPIVALKSYIMSPFSDEKYVDAVLDSISRAREIVGS